MMFIAARIYLTLEMFQNSYVAKKSIRKFKVKFLLQNLLESVHF